MLESGVAWADGSAIAAAAFTPVSFRSIVVYPTQELLKPPFVWFRGGPDWPHFWFQRQVRHCRFDPAIPFDLRPRRSSQPVVRHAAEGVWCGPVAQHFGHMIASFGSRIAVASRLLPHLPLVFSVRPGETPPPFFWQVLAHFGVVPERVLLVAEPTVFRTLAVLPQAEPLFGCGPSKDYLDLLDEVPVAPRAVDRAKLYVSRAGGWKGKIAGELYIEAALQRLGYAPFRPEAHGLDQQLAAYRHATHLIFAEGSALHALQLLGRIPARVTVICRRRGSRLAQAAIAPRANALTYVDAVAHLVHGVGRSGWRQRSAGMTILEQGRFLALLDRQGVPLSTVWGASAFLQQQAHDLGVWIDARHRHPPHSRDGRVIARTLAPARITLPT